VVRTTPQNETRALFSPGGRGARTTSEPNSYFSTTSAGALFVVRYKPQSNQTQVRAAVQEGLTLEQTRKKVNLDKWKKQLAGEDRYRRRAFLDFFETPGIAQAYKEAKGESRDE